MTATQREAVARLLREAPFDLGGDVATQRPLMQQLLDAQPIPGDAHVAEAEVGGVPVTLVDVAGTEPAGVLLHLHGGGFAVGSARGSTGLVANLARRTGMRAVSVDYRLAPEHPFPAALDDAVAAYRELVTLEGGSERIVVSGESAGGNLAVELLISASRKGLPMPAAAVLFSPLTDLTVSGGSYVSKADVDPSITAEAIRTRVRDYLGGTDAADPMVSPVFADLTGLPPLLVQAGTHEVLLDDAILLAAKAAAADVAVVLDVTPGVPHVFQALAPMLDEGDAALARAAAFVMQRLGGTDRDH